MPKLNFDASITFLPSCLLPPSSAKAVCAPTRCIHTCCLGELLFLDRRRSDHAHGPAVSRSSILTESTTSIRVLVSDRPPVSSSIHPHDRIPDMWHPQEVCHRSEQIHTQRHHMQGNLSMRSTHRSSQCVARVHATRPEFPCFSVF